MRRQLPPFAAVRAFEAAARHASFRRAAEELHVSDSAISHQVRRLEEFLGLRLFVREPGGVTLTDPGRAYLASVSDILDSLAECTADARGGGHCRLRVRTTPAFASRWLVPRLGRFQQAHPTVSLYLTTSVAEVDFRTEEVDLVVQYGTAQCDGAVVTPLMESARAPVCAPALLAGEPPLRAAADLRRLVLLRDMVGDGWDEWFSRVGLPTPEPSGPHFEHCELSLQAAEQGQGVALAYLALIGRELATGSLVRPFEAATSPRVIYSTAVPDIGADRPSVRAFLQWLHEEAGVAATPSARCGPVRIASVS